MANQEHLEILKQGVETWNLWRTKNPLIFPDLSEARLAGRQLYEFVGLNPNDPGAGFVSRRLNLRAVNLSRADLSAASLVDADLSYARLGGANLSGAILTLVDFTEAVLADADISRATLDGTRFGKNDLSAVRGLETVLHEGPSIVGVDTMYLSGGRIPAEFLRGCGVPDELIEYLPSLLGAQQAIQFYSCFISYSTKDEEFVRRLYSRMRDEHLRVWFAPEDIRGGRKLYEQIDRAIQLHDRLLLVLSEASMQSEWVMAEIRRARKTEVKEGRRKLFPIRLVGYDAIREWECFDADHGKDLAVEVREYYIPDFSGWKDHDAFERAFERLLRDLKAEEKEAK